MNVWQQLLVVSGGNIVFFCLQVWYFHWKKRDSLPEDISWRIGRLEDAFIAHTGITLNGKQYKKEH